jgi:hypothetical protein
MDNIMVGDEIKVQVCGKKFMLYDDKISIIGKIIKDKEENIVIQDNDDEETDVLDIQQQEDLEQDENIIIDSVLHDESEYDDDESEIVKKIHINDEEIDRHTNDDVEDDDEEVDDDEDDDDEEFDDIDEEEFDMEMEEVITNYEDE